MKVFISYALENKKEAGNLYKLLELLGFECFLAHKDIKKGDKWREAIVRELKKSDVFIPLLSEEGLASAWVHQESGMAHLLCEKRKLLIVPITVDNAVPPGCLSEYQSLSVNLRFFGLGGMNFNYDIVDKLASEISDQVDCYNDIKDKAIANLINVNYQEYEFILGYIYGTGKVSFNDFLELINSGNSNYSLVYSRVAMGYMFKLLETYKDEINKYPDWVKAWNKLWGKYEKYQEEERKRQEELARKQRESVQRMLDSRKSSDTQQ